MTKLKTGGHRRWLRHWDLASVAEVSLLDSRMGKEPLISYGSLPDGEVLTQHLLFFSGDCAPSLMTHPLSFCLRMFIIVIKNHDVMK